MSTQVQYAYINTDSGFKPRIEGRRITVQHIVVHHEHFDWDVARIAEAFNLTPAQVHAALAYYHDHKEAIDESITEDEALFEAIPKVDEALYEIMTPQEVADEYPITVDAVYQAIRRGRLESRKSGKAVLVLRRDAERLWQHKKQK